MRFALPLALLTCSTMAFAQGMSGADHVAPIQQGMIVGGWSPAAVADADVRAAAHAMLAKLPVKHAKLRRIETAQRQVVAGTNYRLTLRLANGARWSGTVWHKLDRTYAVSDLK